MLGPDQTLAQYRLIEKIGQGGMGEVWRATDTRLDREVAVKVLPEQLARDSSGLDRFAREAKLLASLNHPGIATIHDVNEHEGVRFLVMELVAGEDLGQSLERGSLPLAEALDVGLQVANAVEAAHGQGVVHRDLKPANVKRTADGQVKVLDFGLAKAFAPDVSGEQPSVTLSPTMTSAGTMAGVILGTAAYMSPEQARGRVVDRRTDIWSFGVLLYELLTGDNPFRGDTVADSVGAIMHRNPDLDALPAATPTAVRRLLKRCLTRERAKRLHDIADARIELEDAIADPEAESAPAAAAAAGPAPASRLPWVALALLLPLVAALGWFLGSREEPAPAEPTRRFKLAADVQVRSPVLSPDGTRIAYVVGNELLVRSLDSLEPRRLEFEANEETRLFWSPTGESLGIIRSPSGLLRFDLDAGAPVLLTEAAQLANEASWGEDGFIYFTRFQAGIARVPETGGAPEDVLQRHDDMVDFHGMALLPGGRGILTIPHLMASDARKIFLERPGEGPVELHTSDSVIGPLRYSPTGHILFHRLETPKGLWALPFSPESGQTTGDPFLVMPDLNDASFSATGDMIYAQAALQSGKQKQQIVWLDRSGQEVDRADVVVYQANSFVLSPDGNQVALVASGVGRPSTDPPAIWVVDPERGTGTRLTTGPIVPTAPAWNEDGTRIAYHEPTPNPDGSKNVFSVRADGAGEPELLLSGDIQFFVTLNLDWSVAAFMRGSIDGENGMGIATQRVDDPSSFATLVDGPRQEAAPSIHPSGKWIAYLTGDLPNMELVVRPFPDGEGQWKVARAPAGLAQWSADGTKLYYAEAPVGVPRGTMLEIEFDGSMSAPTFGTPQRLFAYEGLMPVLAPDGRFVQIVDEQPAEGAEPLDLEGIILVENWIRRFE